MIHRVLALGAPVSQTNTAQRVAMFCRSPSGLAHKTGAMRIINGNQSIVFVCQITDFVDLGDRAVHGKRPVSHDHPISRTRSLFELRLQVSHVVVFIDVALGFTQTNAINDGGLVELIGDNGA